MGASLLLLSDRLELDACCRCSRNRSAVSAEKHNVHLHKHQLKPHGYAAQP